MKNRDVYITFPTVLLRIFFYPFATWHLCKNKKVLARLFLMIDKICLALVLVYVGVLGFINIFLEFTEVAWFYQLLYILYPILLVLYSGNFRVMMVYCDWNRIEVIFFKFTLLVGSTSYFVLGMYYLV